MTLAARALIRELEEGTKNYLHHRLNGNKPSADLVKSEISKSLNVANREYIKLLNSFEKIPNSGQG